MGVVSHVVFVVFKCAAHPGVPPSSLRGGCVAWVGGGGEAVLGGQNRWGGGGFPHTHRHTDM